ncbi:MAG: hypothetical protein ACYCX3_02670 [Thermoleophilia bacterium]
MDGSPAFGVLVQLPDVAVYLQGGVEGGTVDALLAAVQTAVSFRARREQTVLFGSPPWRCLSARDHYCQSRYGAILYLGEVYGQY